MEEELQALEAENVLRTKGSKSSLPDWDSCVEKVGRLEEEGRCVPSFRETSGQRCFRMSGSTPLANTSVRASYFAWFASGMMHALMVF